MCIHHNHTHVQTYIHACIHAYLPTYLPAYIHTYMRAYMRTYMHEFIYAARKKRAKTSIGLHLSPGLLLCLLQAWDFRWFQRVQCPLIQE